MSGYTLIRRSGVWHYRFQVDGKRTTRSTRESVKYKAAAIAAKAYADARTWARGETPVPTVRELLTDWLQVHRLTMSPAHIKAMESFGRLHLYALGDVLLDEVTTDMVEESRNLHLATHSRATANHWLNYLRALFGWAVRRRIIPALPWKVGSLKVQKKPRPMLPVSSAWSWLAVIDARQLPGISMGVRLMFGIGLREVESLTARWEWVDWDRHTYTPGVTKGREAEPLPLPDWLYEYLLERRQAHGLMVTRLDGQPYASGYARVAIRTANEKCSVLNVTPHRLRGTFATLLSEAGAPIQVVQRLMRHKDPKTTMNYLETNLGTAVRAQAVVSDRLRAASTQGEKK